MGSYSPIDAARRHIESLNELNYSSPEVGESTSKYNGSRVDLSWNGTSSKSEDTSEVGQISFADSNLHEIGAIASAVLEKREGVDLSRPLASSQNLQIESFKDKSYGLLEDKETTLSDDEGRTKLSYQDHFGTLKDIQDAERTDFPNSNFPDLGAIASTLSERSEGIGLSPPEASPGFLDMKSFKEENHSLPEVIETTFKDNEGGVKSLHQDPYSTPQDAPDVEEAGVLDSNLQVFGAIASALSEKSEKIGPSLPQTSPEVKALQSHVHLTEESDSVNGKAGTDLNQSPIQIDKTKDVSAVLDIAVMKDNNLEKPNYDAGYELQAVSFPETTRSARDELYLFYENTSAPDNLEHLQGINGSSTNASRLEKNNFPLTMRNSFSNMLQEDNNQAAGYAENLWNLSFFLSNEFAL